LPHRAPADHVLLRAFFRPSAHDLSTLSDGSWTERAERGLAVALNVHGPAMLSFVSRWPNALPVFDPAHRARVAALEATLRSHAHPIWLAGAAFHGSGIDAAIRSAEAAARAISNGS
jgi:oxygen-dependent protoporphyrinogen oxidase